VIARPRISHVVATSLLRDESSCRTWSPVAFICRRRECLGLFLGLEGTGGDGPRNSSPTYFLPRSRRISVAKNGPSIRFGPLMGMHQHTVHTATKSPLPLTSTTTGCSSMMWRLSLFILYAASLFALVSADVEIQHAHFPLNTCILIVQSTIGKVADPKPLITYGAPMPSRSRAERDA